MRHLVVAGLVLTLAGCANSGAGMNEAAQVASAIASQSTAAQPGTRSTITELIGLFAGTPVTGQQAVGGTAALLGLAQSQLGGNQYAQLAQQVPGLTQLTGSNAMAPLQSLGLLGNAYGESRLGEALNSTGSMAGVNQAFSALGMDSSMVGVFSNLLLQYFGGKGVSAPLLQSLASVWGVQG